MSASGLSKARFERMHDVMAGYVDRGQVPGLVALVSRGGELRVEALGSLAAGGQSPVQHDTIFRIASMVKLLTSVAAMQLVEQGKLDLDAPAETIDPTLSAALVLTGFDAKGAPELRKPKKPSITFSTATNQQNGPRRLRRRGPTQPILWGNRPCN